LVVIDPVVHYNFSPYNAFDNNPVFWADPSGADAYDTAMALFNATPRGYNSFWTNNNDGSFSSSTGVLYETESMTFFYSEGLPELTIDAYRTRWGRIGLGQLSKVLTNHVYSNSKFYEQMRSDWYWNTAHEALDMLGMVPVAGEIFDGINAGLYAYRGDYAMAALSAAAIIPIAGYAATGTKIIKKNVGNAVDATKVLSDSEILRIQNAATRINKPITVVGSRASGTANVYSDWDYVIPDINSKDWGKIKNSLPGARSTMENTKRNIDIFKGPVNTNLPHLTIYPHQ
jgi:hypothetical protein